MTVGAIILARSASTRLPNKHFFKVCGKPILYQLVKRLKKIKKIKKIILATTNDKSDFKFIKFTKKYKINLYRGHKTNCLLRVYTAAKLHKLKTIIFITGDCPIIDIELTKKFLDIYFDKKVDYVGNTFVRSYPDGMDVQVLSFSILKKNYQNTHSLLEKEHVTLGIKKNKKKYKLINIKAPVNLYWPKLGLTLDVYEDYLLLKKIIEYFYEKRKYFFNCEDVIKLLKNRINWVKMNCKVKRLSNYL
jgi:spore coat polysaccharide biosynthesis protein SpsF